MELVTVFSHESRKVEQNKSIIAIQHLNLEKKSWLQFLLFPLDLKTENLTSFVVSN